MSLGPLWHLRLRIVCSVYRTFITRTPKRRLHARTCIAYMLYMVAIIFTRAYMYRVRVRNTCTQYMMQLLELSPGIAEHLYCVHE